MPPPVYLPENTPVTDERRMVSRAWRTFFNALMPGAGATPAPSTAPYVTVGASGLAAARVLTAGAGITVTDGGAGSTVTVTATGSPAPDDGTYLTVSDETADLANSRRVLAGTGIAFDDTTPGVRTIEATGSVALTSAVGITIDGGGSAITTGVKGYVQVPFAGTITSVTMLADQSGSAVVDIWKDTYANAPPTDADSITASAVPTISAADKSTDATLTGWTTSITAGDVIGFNVDSASTIERLTVQLAVART